MAIGIGVRRGISLPTRGICMLPWIWPNGAVIVGRCTPRDLRRGGNRGVVRRPGIPGSPRPQRRGKWVITRGDLTGSADPVVEACQLVGKVRRFERGAIRYRLDGVFSRYLGMGLAPAGRRLRRVASLVRAAIGRTGAVNLSTQRRARLWGSLVVRW